MTYYEQINNHIKNKFLSMDKIKELNIIPTDSELDDMDDNILYKIPLICVAVDVVNFKNLNQNTNPVVMASIMSEFTYGIVKIMKEFDGQSIDIQGDGIYCILNGSEKKDMDNSFSLSCALNVFKNHINKMIKNYFEDELKDGSYHNTNIEFNFGIGMWFSFENYISKVGYRKNRDLIFMGESVNFANELAKNSSRNSNNSILMNDLLKHNFTDEKKRRIDKIGGFYSTYLNFLDYKIWGCNWVSTNYNNYVNNNI